MDRGDPGGQAVQSARPDGAGRRERGGDRRAEVRARLERERDDLVHELTILIPARLGREQRHGEYLSVLDRQSAVHRRIRLIGRLLAGLPSVAPEEIGDDRVGYGSVVFLRNLDTGCEASFMLVEGDPADPAAIDVPLDSPIGDALVGRRVGSEVVLAAPHGSLRFRLLALHTLPASLGIDPCPGPASPRDR